MKYLAEIQIDISSSTSFILSKENYWFSLPAISICCVLKLEMSPFLDHMKTELLVIVQWNHCSCKGRAEQRIWVMPFKKRFSWKQSLFDARTLIHSPIRLSTHIMTNLSSIKIVCYPKMNQLNQYTLPKDSLRRQEQLLEQQVLPEQSDTKAMRPPPVSPGRKKQTLVGNWGRGLLVGTIVLLRQSQESDMTVRTGKTVQSWRCIIVTQTPGQQDEEELLLLFPMCHAPLTTWTSWTAVWRLVFN